MRVIDTVLTQQALITGRILDALTGEVPLSPPSIELTYQPSPGGTPRRFPLFRNLLPGGLYAFVGDPLTAFPRLSGGATLDLRLTATAPGYQAATADFSLTPAQVTPTAQSRTIDERVFDLLLLGGPVHEQDLALQPVPLHLAGRIVDAEDRDTGLAGAQVDVTAPEARGPVTTDAEGFFTLRDLPVAARITVRVELAPRPPLSTTVTLDYRHPVNQQTFALGS
jgi:hypothetical protein